MNWFYVLLPIAGVHVWWPGLVILGLGVGIIGASLAWAAPGWSRPP